MTGPVTTSGGGDPDVSDRDVDERTAAMPDDPAAARPVAMSEVTRRQRLVVNAAGVTAVLALMLGGGLDDWLAGLFGAVGVGLGLGNALLTEASMIRMTSTGSELSRKQFALSAFGRLAAISLVAFILVVAFWPAGAFVLAGLAVFQLLTIFLTALPLLKELRQS